MELVWIKRVSFHHCRKRRGKVTKGRQACFALSRHSAFTHTASLPGMFLLSSKHLSEKLQPKCHLPQAFLLWVFLAIFQYHKQSLNIIITCLYVSSPTRLGSQGQYLHHLCISLPGSQAQSSTWKPAGHNKIDGWMGKTLFVSGKRSKTENDELLNKQNTSSGIQHKASFSDFRRVVEC